MKLLINLLKNKYLYLGLGIIFLYFFTRLYNILSLPIFTDEAIYVRWAQIAGSDANWRFISLTDGKQPLYIWFAMILVKIFEDPLFAGRLVSVIAGFGTMVGLFFLASELFKDRKIGLLACLIYVLFPFALVYDRLAIYDSLVAMLIVWAMYFEVLLIKHLRLDLALILGMIMGLGMLTKTSNNFAFILLPFSLLLINLKNYPNKEDKLKRIGYWCVLALVSVIIAQAMYSILRLTPFYHIIGQKNIAFVYPLTEWITKPFAFLFGNLRGLGGWLLSYMTAPFLILSFSAFLIEKKYLREKLFLLVWFLAPFMALAFFGKVIYPRFILFMTMPLLVLGAYTLFMAFKTLQKTWQKVLIAIVFLMLFIMNSFLILTDFENSRIPEADKEQFITGWPSGVGVRETVEFLDNKSKDQKIFVGTEGTFGLMPYSLLIYLKDNKNIEIEGYWPIKDTLPEEVVKKANVMPVYFVFYQPCPSCPQAGIAPVTWPVKEVFKIKKEGTDNFYTLYQVLPQ
jgi:4-amino-4-deoxy-L-arabinose transferase-like glycosyltransferase